MPSRPRPTGWGAAFRLSLMAAENLRLIAQLLQERNKIDEQIASVIHRPMTAGHLGEWLAAEIFDIELEPSAVATALDGRFRSGPLRGRTVNVKWYLRSEGLLDLTLSDELDEYLVMTGPVSAALSSRGQTRPSASSACSLLDVPSRRPAGSRAGEPASPQEASEKPRCGRRLKFSRLRHARPGCRCVNDRSSPCSSSESARAEHCSQRRRMPSASRSTTARASSKAWAWSAGAAPAMSIAAAPDDGVHDPGSGLERQRVDLAGLDQHLHQPDDHRVAVQLLGRGPLGVGERDRGLAHDHGAVDGVAAGPQ